MAGKLRCRPGNQRIFKATMTRGAMPNACYGCRGGSCVPHFAPRLKIRMTSYKKPCSIAVSAHHATPAGGRVAGGLCLGRRLREVQAEEPFEEMIAAELSQEAEAQKAEDIERMQAIWSSPTSGG